MAIRASSWNTWFVQGEPYSRTFATQATTRWGADGDDSPCCSLASRSYAPRGCERRRSRPFESTAAQAIRHWTRLPMSTRPSMLARTLWIAFAILGSLCGQGWVDVSFSVQGQPPAGNWPIVFDENVNKVILVGGAGNTWSYDGTSWVLEQPVADLPGHLQNGGITAAVYDANLGQTLCLWYTWINGTGAGCGGALRQSKIFGWDGQRWTELLDVTSSFGSQAPLSRMAYDARRGSTVIYNYALERLVCFNGTSSISYTNSTYLFDGVALQPTQPLVRPASGGTPQAFYYDSDRQVSVMLLRASPFANSTEWWEWDGVRQNWAQSFPALPVSPGSTAYSPANHCAISMAIDGRSPPSRPYAYKFRGDMAEQLFLNRYPSLREAPIVYDRARGVFVLVGGCTSSGSSPCYSDTWELQLGPSASYSFFGSGCSGSRGTVGLSLFGGGPAIGSPFTVQVNNLPLVGPTFMALGFSNTSYGASPLPFDLGPIGAPGCPMLISPDQLYAIPNVLGVSIWSITVPNLPGVQFYNQAFCLDPSANSLGISVSNAGSGTIGS